MRLISWAFRVALFFVLFAFAMNNLHDVELRWFFGLSSHAPMVLVVFLALLLGCVLGALGMLPSWWRQRRRASRAVRRLDTAAPAGGPSTPRRAAHTPDTELPVRPDGI
jgi:uncharacterized integral membrane protein